MDSFCRCFVICSVFVSIFFLEGCAHSPFVTTPVGWYHDIEGGIIAQPRLPVPGADKVYPFVGLTPTTVPPVPSPALRQNITDSLEKERNLSEWQNAVIPLPAPLPIPPSHPVSKQPENPNSVSQNNISSASFDAVGSPDETSGNKKVLTPSPASSVKTVSVSEGPVAMPELRTQTDEGKVVILPAIPLTSPAPPEFPGISVPKNADLPPPEYPSALPLSEPAGELIRFPKGSDTPYAKQENTINSIAWHRAGRNLYVHGYGDADSIKTDGQASAVSLALLRAQAVAKMLVDHHVPATAIIIRAHAFGHGVRIRMDE